MDKDIRPAPHTEEEGDRETAETLPNEDQVSKVEGEEDSPKTTENKKKEKEEKEAVGDAVGGEKEEEVGQMLMPFVVDANDSALPGRLEQFLNEVEALEYRPASETRPYEHKYHAYELLESLERQLSAIPEEERGNHLQSIHGRAYLRMGIIAYDTDEWSKAEQHLKHAIRLLQKESIPLTEEEQGQGSNVKTFQMLESNLYNEEGNDASNNLEDLSPAGMEVLESVRTGSVEALKTEFVNDLTQGYNYLGMIWTGRADHRLAELCFKKSEAIYNAFQGLRLNEAMKDNDPLVMKVESTFTMITFFLAQMYSNLSFPHLSAKYSFLTLKRQINSEQYFNKEEWAVNAMTLSNYYLNHGDFGQSEHCLNAAQYMLQSVEGRSNEQAEPNLEVTIARHYHVWLDFSTKWLMEYCRKPKAEIQEQESLNASERIMEYNEPTETATIEPQHQIPVMQFDNILIDPPQPYTVITNFAQALPAFKHARQGYEAGLKYFVLDGFVTDHVGNLQNLSNLYNVLTFFEKDVDRTIANLYERDNLLKELSPQFYNGELKQISFELGEIYGEILDLLLLQKHRNIKSIQTAHKAIRNFQYFVQLFKDPESGKENIEEVNHHAYVRARLHLARLYFKLEVEDAQETLKNWSLSLTEYDKAIALCKDKQIEGVLEQEITMAQQMRELIPLKMREYMLRNGIN